MSYWMIAIAWGPPESKSHSNSGQLWANMFPFRQRLPKAMALLVSPGYKIVLLWYWSLEFLGVRVRIQTNEFCPGRKWTVANFLYVKDLFPHSSSRKLRATIEFPNRELCHLHIHLQSALHEQT